MRSADSNELSGISTTDANEASLSRQQATDPMAIARLQEQAILDNIPDIAWLKDKESQYVLVNEAFAKACNTTREKLVGKTDYDVWPKELAEKYRADDREVMATRARKRVDEPIVYADGSSLIIETIKTPIYDVAGNVIGTTGIARDITAKTRAEKELRDRETLYRTLFDSSAAAFLLIRDFNFIDCNDRACRLFGLERAQIVGSTLADLSPISQPDGKSSQEAIEVRFAAASNGSAQHFNWRLRGNANEQIETEIALKPITLQSEVLVLAEIRDVTARLKAEIRLQEQLRFLQQLIDSVPTPVFYKDLDGSFIGCNRSFCDCIGRERREIMGRDATELFNEGEARTITQFDNELITLKTAQHRELRLTFADSFLHDVILHQAVFRTSGESAAGIVGTIVDITDIRDFEQQLRESEERFRVAIVNSGMIVSHQDRELTYEWVYNPVTPQELDSSAVEPASDAFWSDDAAAILELKKRVLETGIGESIEFQSIIARQKKFFNLIVEPRRDHRNQVVGIINVALDITNLKHAERLLTESHQLLAGLMKNLPGIIYRCRNDNDRTLEFVSEGCFDLTGYHPEDLIGNKKLSFGGLIHPDDRHAANNVLQTALNRDEQYELTYRILTATGQEKWIWERGWAESEFNEGRVTLQGLILDMTEQKSDEERRMRLTAAVEQAAESIMITNADGKILYVNPAFEEITGYTKSEVLGRNPSLMKSGQHSEEFYRELWATILRGEAWKGHFVNRRKDGTLIEEEASIRAIKDSSGKIINYVAVQRDVTKIVALETQLRQAQKLEAVGSLAAGIAHEINTPIQFVGDNTHFLSDAYSELISVLEGAIDLTKDGFSRENCPSTCRNFLNTLAKTDLSYLKEEIPKAIEQSLQGIDRVAKIVRAMKDFSHPDKREKSSIDINHALKTTLTVARNELKYVADVVEDFAPDLPPLMCYPSELNQVFLNLLVNAAHAVGEVVSDSNGRGTIHIRSRQEGESIVIAISDTGGGIRKEVRDRIFEPFFTTKEVGRGTGQGLAIARSVVVEKHKGQIYFESEVGQGTTFYVKLPIAENKDDLV